jgi:hypothetical protein
VKELAASAGRKGNFITPTENLNSKPYSLCNFCISENNVKEIKVFEIIKTRSRFLKYAKAEFGQVFSC